jgi:glycine/D-amino acid oxidase-like deaminating enzyme
MGITIETIEPDASLPASSDVVIIGGGIIGIMTGLFLAKEGVSVTVCEKGEVGHEQSGRNWGWVRIMGRDASEIPMGLESMRLWSEMDKLVGGDTGFTRSGIVYVADTPAKLAEHEAWLDHAKQYQLDSRLLSTKEIESVLPGNKRAFAGALFTPSDARAEPQKAVPAMARALRRHGGTVLTAAPCAASRPGAGRVSAVVTERGTIACQRVCWPAAPGRGSSSAISASPSRS